VRCNRALALMWVLGVFGLSIGVFSGCSFQHAPFRLGNNAHQPSPDLYFVEADDYGWFWDPDQARKALSAVRSSEQTDTLVLIFVAGWHHSTRCCDDNVVGFEQVLMKLQDELKRKMYDEARKVIHRGSADPVHVMGIYIGWRGRSLPGFPDYFTFWGRKAAAMRVGESDVREFLVDLRNIYENHARAQRGASDPRLLGLVTIGHSFGGQVVLRATSTFIEQELMLLGAQPSYLRVPATPGSGPDLSSTLGGFGDLVILINPAVEAAAYQRLHALGISPHYSSSQTPVMLTISAENDTARKWFFPFGRKLGEILTGKPEVSDAREREMERATIGFELEQVTHRLEPIDQTKRLHGETLHRRDPTCPDKEYCRYTWYRWSENPKGVEGKTAPDSLSADDCNDAVLGPIAAHDFSARSVFANVALYPTAGNIPNQPLIVASASRDVIDNHNGMFSEPLLQFLTRYIGFVEARRFLPLMGPGACGSRASAR